MMDPPLNLNLTRPNIIPFAVQKEVIFADTPGAGARTWVIAPTETICSTGPSTELLLTGLQVYLRTDDSGTAMHQFIGRMHDIIALFNPASGWNAATYILPISRMIPDGTTIARCAFITGRQNHRFLTPIRTLASRSVTLTPKYAWGAQTGGTNPAALGFVYQLEGYRGPVGAFADIGIDDVSSPGVTF